MTKRSKHCVLTCALGPDSAGTLLSARLMAAATRIDAGVYEVSVYYAWLFRRAAEAGVDVRVMLDGHGGANSGTAGVLANGDICRILGSRIGAEAHWKLLRIDGGVAVGTGNLLHRDAPRDPHGLVPPAVVTAGAGTREWWMFVDGDPELAGAVAAALASRWVRGVPPSTGWRSPGTPRIPPVGIPRPLIAPVSIEVAPESLRLVVGGRSAAVALRARFDRVRARMLVTVPYVHAGVAAVAGLVALMVRARSHGADVRLLLGADGASANLDVLIGAGVDVRTMDPERSTTGHAKGVVADDAVVVMSSNWSAAGLGGNLESALAVDDARAADYFAAAFEHDWTTGRPAATPAGISVPMRRPEGNGQGPP